MLVQLFRGTSKEEMNKDNSEVGNKSVHVLKNENT